MPPPAPLWPPPSRPPSRSSRPPALPPVAEAVVVLPPPRWLNCLARYDITMGASIGSSLAMRLPPPPPPAAAAEPAELAHHLFAVVAEDVTDDLVAVVGVDLTEVNPAVEQVVVVLAKGLAE